MRLNNSKTKGETHRSRRIYSLCLEVTLSLFAQDPSATAANLVQQLRNSTQINTIFGQAIAKYDTLNQCWVSFDLQQTGGMGVKIFAKIELSILQLFAVTTDNKLYVLYAGPGFTSPSVRTVGICSNTLYANNNIRMNNPGWEIKPSEFRLILNKITETGTVSVTPFVNNRVARIAQNNPIVKTINYSAPPFTYVSPTNLPDVNTQLNNLLFSLPNNEQCWKLYFYISWTTGSVTQFSTRMLDLTPMNPLTSQKSTV